MNPLLMFLILPVLEIAVFIQVGGWIGLWPTVLLIVLATVLGSVLLRWQGLAVLRRAQASADRGEVPVGALFEGFCIVTAAILLIIPGFLTDAVGLLLFVPFLRNALGRWLFERLRRHPGVRIHMGGHGAAGTGQPPPARRPSPGVIDAEYHEVPAEEEDAPTLSQSRWRPGSNRPDRAP